MKTLNSKLFFVGLQLADLLTTLLCFRYGLTEMGPLPARLIMIFGVGTGLMVTKILCCLAIAPMSRKVVWVGNISYMIVVLWNCFLATVFGLAHFATTSRL